jgi:Transposase IS4
VWAKAEAVSRDAKRVYGSEVSNTWLRGTVLEVLTQRRNAASKRSTTYVKAAFMCGNLAKTSILPLQTLKDKDPRTETATTASITNNENNNNANVNAMPSQEPLPLQEGSNDVNVQPDSPEFNIPYQVPVACTNGREWYEGITDVDMNGPVPYRSWKMTCQYSGRELTVGCDVHSANVNCTLTPYDFFMACFPKEQLKFMVENTSAQLRLFEKAPLTVGELLKWFGITILMTRFEFGDRSSLWSQSSGSKYIPAPNLGTRTGMSRERYDMITRYLVWSYQPSVRPEGMSSEMHRWMLVQDFVDRINDHRKKYFSPSSIICVDESISRWYGLGGHWINMGLPMYVAMDRKPEDGCEIQNACCGRSGIMMQLRLVRSAAAESAANDHEAVGAAADANGYFYFVV